jgi:hypothetical protein
MRSRLKKVWEVVCGVAWALGHMADAEMEYERSKRTCSNCGHVRTSGGDTGPR